jgi:hypothetical protein
MHRNSCRARSLFGFMLIWVLLATLCDDLDTIYTRDADNCRDGYHAEIFSNSGVTESK